MHFSGPSEGEGTSPFHLEMGKFMNQRLWIGPFSVIPDGISEFLTVHQPYSS